MADPRTFTLIGEFKDGITPELEKINRQLAALKTNFAGVGSKKNTGFRGATQEIGKLVSAHKKLSESIKGVQGDLRSTVGVLQQYRKEMGKAAAATRAFQKAGGSLGGKQFSQNMDSANRSAQAYLRTLQQINAQSRRMPRGGMGGGFQPPRPPRGGGGYGGMGGGIGGAVPPTPRKKRAGGGGMGAHMAEFGFAYTLGSGLAQPIQNAIVQGFQIGVGFMTKPFEYFANRLGERMQDELSDLKAAGGFFSMAKRQESPFVKNFADAIQFTQENNKVMARLAASLPGKTQDYIEVAKRVSDSVARTVLNDRAATMKMAEQIRAGDIRTYGAKSITEMTGSEATKKTIQVLLGDLTKDTVLAGMGGRAGAGGAMGAYGLPQLSERMISQDEVSMGQMQRYSAIFSDPMIMDALQRNINKINATSKNSADRLKAIANMYKEIVTPELVERYRRTLAGVAETFNTAIFGEETGLFGLGRKMEGLGIKFNEFGQMLDKTGKVTTDVTQAAREDLAIYDLFRDILVNVGQVLAPIVENLNMIYDPLKQLGLDLNKAREATYKVLQSFNYYKKGFEEFGRQFKGKDKEMFDATRDLRAALATVGNVMRYFKVIGEGDFANLIKQLEDPKAQMGPILQKMIDQFLTSDVAGKIGEFLGNIVGTVLTEVAKVTGFISGRLKQSNKLFEGMKKGFNDAGGPAAFRAIFRDVFMGIGKVLLEIAKVIPLEAYMLAAAMVVIPAAVQGLGMLIAEKMLAGIMGLRGGLSQMISQMFARVQATIFRVKPVQVKDMGSRITDPSRMLPPAKETALATTAKAGPLAKGMGAFGKFFMNFGNYIKGVGPRFMGFFKGFLGKLTIFGGAITSIVSLFEGKDLATALAEGAGPVLGAALGAALIPFLGPIGPMIGSAIGGWIGSMKSVTQPLADGIRSVFGTVQTTFDFLVQIGRDLLGLINGLVRIIPGVSKNFDFLRAAMFALLSPFKLLEIAINGLYDLYLTIKSKTVGVSTEEQARLNERRTVRATDEFTIMGREGAGYSLAQQKAAEYAKFQEAKAKGDTAAMNRIAEYMKSIDRMIAQRGGGARTPAKPSTTATPKPTTATTKPTTATVPKPTPAKPVGADPVQASLRAKALQDIQWFWKKLTTTPTPPPQAQKPPTTPAAAAAVKAPQEVIATAQNTSSLNTKATTQITQAAAIQRSTAETKTIAQTSGTTLGNIKAGVIAVSNKVGSLQSAILGDLNNIQAGVSRISSLLQSGNLKVKSDFTMPGGLPGGGSGGPAIFGSAAQKFGLTMTSGYRPGDPGYHGINRARDYSNGSGPTPQMMAFAQYLYSTFGSNLKELIYTPLGFSVKNGQKVPPYAQAAHYNHVHVAWAFGPQNPVGFGSLGAAQAWENSMIPGSAKVASITANSTEGFGGGSVGDIYVTVNAGSTNDPDQLAYMVADRIQRAVNEAVNSNILV